MKKIRFKYVGGTSSALKLSDEKLDSVIKSLASGNEYIKFDDYGLIVNLKNVTHIRFHDLRQDLC